MLSFQFCTKNTTKLRYQNVFSLVSRAHGIFNPIYDIYATWDSANLLTSYLLQYKYTSRNLQRMCETTKQKAIQLLPNLSEILTCNLQPVTCNLQPAVYTVRIGRDSNGRFLNSQLLFYGLKRNNSRLHNKRNIFLSEFCLGK